MRASALLLIGGLALAVLGVPANADTLQIHISGFDVGTLYDVSAGTTINNSAILDSIGIAPVGGFINGQQSDTWGIISIDQVRDLTTGKTLYNDGGLPSQLPGAPTHLFGIFWGLTDNFLQTATSSATPGGISQDIRGVGIQVAIFSDGDTWPTGAPGPSASGTAGPGGDGKNVITYPGVTATGSVATPYWTFRSTTGLLQSDLNNEVFETFIQDAAGQAFGSSGNFFANMAAVDGYGAGSANDYLDTNGRLAFQAGDAPGVPTKPVDTLFSFGGDPADAASWLLFVDDPITANNVPEPVTMAGLLLGIGCLTRYVRRRK